MSSGLADIANIACGSAVIWIAICSIISAYKDGEPYDPSYLGTLVLEYTLLFPRPRSIAKHDLSHAV